MFKKWMCVFLSSFVLLSLPMPIALSAETLAPQTTAEKELVYGVNPDFKPTKGIFNSSMSLDKILTKDSLDLLESMGVSYIDPDLSALLIEIAEKEPERLKPILEDLAKEKEKTRNAFIEYVDKLYRPYGIHPEDKVSDYRTIAENYLKKRFGVDVHEDTVWKAFQKEHRIDVTEEFAQHQLENNYTREEAIARLYIEDGYEAEWGTLDTIFRDPKCADLRLRDTIFYEKDYKFEIYIPTLKAFLVDLGKTLHPKREEFYEHMGPYYAPRDFNRFYDYANESTESSSSRQEKKRSKRHATKEPDHKRSEVITPIQKGLSNALRRSHGV